MTLEGDGAISIDNIELLSMGIVPIDENAASLEPHYHHTDAQVVYELVQLKRRSQELVSQKAAH